MTKYPFQANLSILNPLKRFKLTGKFKEHDIHCVGANKIVPYTSSQGRGKGSKAP